MILLDISTKWFVVVLALTALAAFLLGTMLRNYGRASKREEQAYWEKMHPLNDDYPEDAQLHNGNIPDYKKAK